MSSHMLQVEEKPATKPAGKPPRPGKSNVALYGAGGLVAALLAIGIIPRMTQRRALAAEVRSATDAVVPVSVATAARAKGGPLSLPGTIQALHETILYARSAGYVKRWYADIGQPVQAGQVLAMIESPEVDQEVQQARATLNQALAALALAKNDLDRWKSLERDSAVSRQELDQKVAAYEANAAVANGQRANLDRLTALQSYQRITAPFAGTVTARNLDIGTLVTPGAGGTSGGTPANASGQGLYRIAQTDTMRVYISVPQTMAPAIHVGLPAQISVQERRGQSFAGRVTRTASALDPSTRTLLVEVQVPNAQRTLLSGSYAQVSIDPGNAALPITVPANALAIDANGTRIATLDAQNKVHYQKVEVGRDYGATVEVLTGVEDGATVVLNPSDAIVDGATVKPVKAAAKK